MSLDGLQQRLDGTFCLSIVDDSWFVNFGNPSELKKIGNLPNSERLSEKFLDRMPRRPAGGFGERDHLLAPSRHGHLSTNSLLL